MPTFIEEEAELQRRISVIGGDSSVYRKILGVRGISLRNIDSTLDSTLKAALADIGSPVTPPTSAKATPAILNPVERLKSHFAQEKPDASEPVIREIEQRANSIPSLSASEAWEIAKLEKKLADDGNLLTIEHASLERLRAKKQATTTALSALERLRLARAQAGSAEYQHPATRPDLARDRAEYDRLIAAQEKIGKLGSDAPSVGVQIATVNRIAVLSKRLGVKP